MTENEIKKLASVLEQAKEKAGNTAGSMNKGFGMWYAQELAKADYCKVQDGAVVLTKDEYEDLCNDYDKVYEQAKADILGNMADGGTSCHWCMDEQYQRGRKETAREIIKFLRSAECLASCAAVDIADMFDMEVEE